MSRTTRIICLIVRHDRDGIGARVGWFNIIESVGLNENLDWGSDGGWEEAGDDTTGHLRGDHVVGVVKIWWVKDRSRLTKGRVNTHGWLRCCSRWKKRSREEARRLSGGLLRVCLRVVYTSRCLLRELTAVRGDDM